MNGSERVSQEWPLDKAQNFLAQLFAARRVGHGREQHLSGEALHLLEGCLPLNGSERERERVSQ